ncbi:PXA domain-containing protein [Geopyxis carbonaria]|nr:PXA domain-containing protein [Geopyxis carbonaria]
MIDESTATADPETTATTTTDPKTADESTAAAATTTATLQQALDAVLAFLATASPEALVGVGVAGVGVCYIVLGRLGLLVVGVVAGAVGHAALSLHTSSAPVPAWLSHPHEQQTVAAPAMRGPVDFSQLPPETARAMEELVDAAVRDYVRYWYNANTMLPKEENFPAAARNMLGNTLLAMYAHIARKRAADTLMMFLVTTTNTFIVFLRELAHANRTSIGTYLEETPECALATMLSRPEQRRRMHTAASDVLRAFFPRDALACEPVRVFFTEVLAGVALEITVARFSQPDAINALLVWLLDVETQPEILQQIDIGDATAAAGGDSAAAKRMSRGAEEAEKARLDAEELNRMIAAEELHRRRSSTSAGSNRASLEHSLDLDIMPNLPPPPSAPEDAFTSFDQLTFPPPPPAAKEDTLHNARVELNDLTPLPPGGESKPLKSKPSTAVYLLQIECLGASGWVVTRKYTDFETLHEVLRRISAISGVESFSRTHPDLPAWRGETPATLRTSLQRYLNDALAARGLAECEGMKRFLEKDVAAAAVKTGGFKGWPNPVAFAKMGQGALDVLAKAPQGVAEGGKGLFGGVKRAFAREDAGRSGERHSGEGRGSGDRDRESWDSARRPESISEAPTGRVSRTHSMLTLELPSPHSAAASVVSLPPPPSDMPDDWSTSSPVSPPLASSSSLPPASSYSPILPPPTSTPSPALSPTLPTPPPASTSTPATSHSQPLTTAETQNIVDLLFALLAELYTLSSAWTLRRSLLSVARSLLLRPGNPALAGIRTALQEGVVAGNTTDAAVAGVLGNLKESVFPASVEGTDGKGEGEQEKGEALRVRARELVLRRGLPEAVRGMMGGVATEEALGAVFDALQDEGVGRAVVAAVVVEAVRGVCQ